MFNVNPCLVNNYFRKFYRKLNPCLVNNYFRKFRSPKLTIYLIIQIFSQLHETFDWTRVQKSLLQDVFPQGLQGLPGSRGFYFWVNSYSRLPVIFFWRGMENLDKKDNNYLGLRINRRLKSYVQKCKYIYEIGRPIKTIEASWKS